MTLKIPVMSIRFFITLAALNGVLIMLQQSENIESKNSHFTEDTISNGMFMIFSKCRIINRDIAIISNEITKHATIDDEKYSFAQVILFLWYSSEINLTI